MNAATDHALSVTFKTMAKNRRCDECEGDNAHAVWQRTDPVLGESFSSSGHRFYWHVFICRKAGHDCSYSSLNQNPDLDPE
jgi:hypothetical protein